MWAHVYLLETCLVHANKTSDSIFAFVAPCCSGNFRRLKLRRRTSPFSGRAFREQGSNVGIVPFHSLFLSPRPSIEGGGQTGLSTARIEGVVFPISSRVGGSGRGCPRLRASNEGLPRPRVLRARRAPAPFFFLFLPSFVQFHRGRAPMLLLLRPSNEALLRARVPGAREQCGCPAAPFSFSLPSIL